LGKNPRIAAPTAAVAPPWPRVGIVTLLNDHSIAK
jgi:hypothetical protein